MSAAAPRVAAFFLALAAFVPASVPAPAPGRRWAVEGEGFVEYRVVVREVEDSDAPPGSPRGGSPGDLHGFYGHEAEEGCRVVRALTHAEWLVVPFVYWWPDTGRDDPSRVEVDEVLPGTWRLGPVRARGAAAVRRDGDAVVVTGLVGFTPAPVPPGERTPYHAIGDGRLTWTTRVDPAAPLPTRIEYDLVFGTGPTGAPPPRAVHSLGAGQRRCHARVVLDQAGVRPGRTAAFAAEVDRAIVQGCEYLQGLQFEDGSFAGAPPFGSTALALLALVRSGRPVDDPAVARGFTWLLAERPRGTYETAAAILAVEALGTPPEEMARARRGDLAPPLPRVFPPRAQAFLADATRYLLENARRDSPGSPRPVTGRREVVRWGYPFEYEGNLEPGERDWWDNSNTQYAVLALHAAARCGVEVPDWAWVGVARHFLAAQAPTGKERSDLLLSPHRVAPGPRGHTYAPEPRTARERGWAYQDCPSAEHAYGSMTAAGISSLTVAAAHLEGGRGAGANRPLSREIAAAIRDGWAALDGMWSAWENPRYPGWSYYHLYGLERAGILADVERVGGRDWYLQGATQLLLRQRDDGSWPRDGSEPHDTAWALLFLARGTTPITPR